MEVNRRGLLAAGLAAVPASLVAQDYGPRPIGLKMPHKIKDTYWTGDDTMIISTEGGFIYRAVLNRPTGMWSSVTQRADVPVTGNGHWRLFPGPSGEVWGHDTDVIVMVWEGNR